MNETQPGSHRPIVIQIFSKFISVLFFLAALAGIVLSLVILINPELLPFAEGVITRQNHIYYSVGIVIITSILAWMGYGFLRYKNWARTILMAFLMFVNIYYFISILLNISSTIFAGISVVPIPDILRVLGLGLSYFLLYAAIPGIVLFGLFKTSPYFDENPKQREFVDKTIRYILLGTALSSIIIVFLIFIFTMTEAWPAVAEIGLDNMLTGTIWRPGSIIGTSEAQFGLLPMIFGSILATFGAVVIGVPLSIGTAILLAEVAPRAVREILRPTIELLAGIPSVVYGLFGMVVLAPLIRHIDVPHNSGFGLLNASIILAVMIIPTITNIAEDAIRAVPREYKEGSLALGGTRWQTIVKVILPAARSGILAGIILGIGRALGETMAMIMVIGNSIAMPSALTKNPLTLFLNTARTLTGNIAVEINYAAGNHRSALFFTGVLLFLMILFVNQTARFFMRSKKE
jgi:phosphate transport system permease protein